MFFEIKQDHDTSFPSQFKLTDQLILNCDQGWTKYRTSNAHVYFKGYHDTTYSDSEFVEIISRDPLPAYTGNFFAVIVNDDQSITTTNDIFRGTPLRIRKDNFLVTNLPLPNTHPVWADKILSIDPNFNVTENHVDLLGQFNANSKLDDEEVINAIDDILNESFELFLTKNNKPLYIFLSGGVDSTICLSYLKKFTNNFKIFAGELFEFTPFICNKKDIIGRYWAYKQLHHLREPSVIVTGGNGDENLLRGPEDANLVLSSLGSSALIETAKNPEAYHYTYFNTEYCKNRFKQQESTTMFNMVSKSWGATANQVLNSISNDHQHWHLETNITFTPLKNLNITKLILNGSEHLIKQQTTDAFINKMLIERNDPSLLPHISPQKCPNQSESWSLYQRYWDHIVKI